MNLAAGMLPIVQPREVREKLAQLKPTDQVTVDLEINKIIFISWRIHFRNR